MTTRNGFASKIVVTVLSVSAGFQSVAADTQIHVETGLHPKSLVVSGPELQLANLQSPVSLPTGQEFGFSTAISSAALLVTAPGQNDLYGVPDIANVFLRDSSGTFSGPTSIPQPNGRPAGSSSSAYLTGNAVAIDGDTIAIGEPLAPVWPNLFQGEVDVYSRGDFGWYLSDILFDNGDTTGQLFGCAVALSGDTLIVSACNFDFSGGRVYVYVKSGGHWDVQARLTSIDHMSDQYFGYTAAIDGNTVVLGAPVATNPAGKITGAAYVFERSGTTWSDGIRFDITGEDNDYFGGSVAVSGNTIVIGAPAKTVGTTANAGAAYVYQRSGLTWKTKDELISPTGGVAGAFGSSIALVGKRLVVGEMQASAAYVFVEKGGKWLREASLYGTANTDFGASVSMSKSSPEFVVSAPYEVSGHAYIFESDLIFADGFEAAP